MSAIATAALPVAIALLVFAIAARAALWAKVDDLERPARQYLEPLSTWALAALAVYAVALLIGGEAGLMSFLLPLVLAGVAVAVRVEAAEPAPAAPAPRVAAPARAAPAQDGSLWSGSDPTHRAGLWER